MALNFPVDSFSDRFGVWPPLQSAARPYPKNPLDPNDPNYDPVLDPHSPQYNPNDPRLVGGVSPQVLANGPPISGPSPPSQQPTLPINTAQGAPQRLQSTPNSPPLVGGFANNALGAGGNGRPMGGLPTQSPMTELWQFNQAQQAPSMPPVAGPANPMFRMQQHQANLQRLQQYLSRLGGYSFQG